MYACALNTNNHIPQSSSSSFFKQSSHIKSRVSIPTVSQFSGSPQSSCETSETSPHRGHFVVICLHIYENREISIGLVVSMSPNEGGTKLKSTWTAVFCILMLLSLIGYILKAQKRGGCNHISLVVQRETKQTRRTTPCGSDRETMHTSSSLLLSGWVDLQNRRPKYNSSSSPDTSDSFWLSYKYFNWFRTNFWCLCETRFCFVKSRYSSEWKEKHTSAP